ncbi:DoxX family protein [Lacinutrix sp. Hel_I_90]|uniref:DoxX family protein n=1 Tax=Lacinutrix sp. Hel_I_90 TaxID=1249999 RepID=UPI0005C869BB|nr:DoxX family protein [Lacinutrix sp. Hel_I_90]
MGTIKSLNKWANAHTHFSIDIVRIALGLFLFIKGLHFMQNISTLNALFEPIQNIPGGMLLLHYIIPAHFIGGILLVFGLLTRWVIIAQLPILIGAVIINFTGEMNSSNLILAIAVLVVCLWFLVYGSGKHSADYYLKMQQ